MKKEGFDRTYESHIKEDETMKELIDKILKDFDFKKVHTAMRHTNWIWLQSDMEVPSISQLVLCAQELLENVSKMEVGHTIGIGGFKVTKIDSEDMGDGLELEFILASSSYYEGWLWEKQILLILMKGG